MTSHIDAIALCATCTARIEHVAGEPGSEWRTPFWRHLIPKPHPALPAESTIVQQGEQ